MGLLILGNAARAAHSTPQRAETSLALLSRHLDIYSPWVTCAAPAPLRPRKKSLFPPPGPILLQEGLEEKAERGSEGAQGSRWLVEEAKIGAGVAERAAGGGEPHL